MKINFLGDVHLGRTFRSGVPMHRRGDREKMVFDQFVAELALPGDITIQVGDIFDRHRVDLNVVMATFGAIRDAALVAPDQTFYFLAGNHDLSKDSTKVSSFDVLAELCSNIDNVNFLKEPETFSWPNLPEGPLSILFLPYDPLTPAALVAAEAAREPVDLVVGHWDRVAPTNDFNLLPLTQLAKITKRVITGHDHVAQTYQEQGVQVDYVGSMQPFSFAEDPTGTLYQTLTMEQVNAALAVSPDVFHNLGLRILVGPDDVPPTDIDCLQLSFKKLGDDGLEDITVDFEDGLDLDALFADVTDGIDVEIQGLLKNKFKEFRNA